MKSNILLRRRLSVDIPIILDKRLRKLNKKSHMTKTRSVIRALLMYCTHEELNENLQEKS
ncbi:hypothetical protein UFOVP9_60 [uncultured Caudovirales phage]|jgi:hypothetical protein|uniref:Uncharacterized protein n=1 Tax=uncultured Caudovirales phage TaxID=2100421 RepID=A0A6J5KIV1_9CAUD|nr:hypothetical protein UFOVP9_60 [uncultured Caudovirales phage]